MKALFLLLLPLLAWLYPALATAAEEGNKPPPSLAEVAASKVGAMLLIREKQPNPEPGLEYGFSIGMFISADGHALLNLGSLATPRTNLDDLPKLEATAPPALQVRRLQDRASFLAVGKKDYQGALREYTPALALCPKDFPDVLGNMADCHRQLAHWDEFEAMLRQVHALDPESISLASVLETLLIRQGKLKEAQEFTDKIFELEGLYRAK